MKELVETEHFLLQYLNYWQLLGGTLLGILKPSTQLLVK